MDADSKQKRRLSSSMDSVPAINISASPSLSTSAIIGFSRPVILPIIMLSKTKPEIPSIIFRCVSSL